MTSVQQTAFRAADRPVAGRHPIVPGEVTTARVDGCEVEVQAEHRRWVAPAAGSAGCGGYEPVAVEVTASTVLSLDDVAAMLFVGGSGQDELDDPDEVRELVADRVVFYGGQGITELRRTLLDRVGPDDAAWLAHCRSRAAEVFGVPDPRRSGQVA